jgi:hypothetical protein
MTATELVLPFLEQRTYLHGTTLFEAMRAEVPSTAALSFKVSRRIDSNRVRIETTSEGDGSTPHPAASISWALGARRGSLAVTPLPRQDPIRRESYDESLVARIAVVHGHEAALSGVAPFGFVATLVPLFKVLLKSTCQPREAGQWMFIRMDLERHPDSLDGLRLVLDAFAGGKLARSRIFTSGRQTGTLYYSWVPF